MKYLLSFLLFVAIVVGLIIGVIVIRDALGGSTASVPTHSVDLNKYAKSGTTFRLREEGPIVADENHRALEITITEDGRHAQLEQGYNGTVDDQQDYDNNINAYKQFVAALSQTSWRLQPDTKPSDWQGQCPTGRRYSFDILDGDKVVKSGWTTSCSTTAKHDPSMADYGNISSLFRAQIPDVNHLIAGSGL